MNDCVSVVGQKQLVTISIVTFNPNFGELRKTLDSLVVALSQFETGSFSVIFVDNSEENSVSVFLQENYSSLPMRLIHGQGNIGFGRAHNLALSEMGEFHLALNPDVELHPDALENAIAFMKVNPQCGLITPYAEWPNGERQYLCKRYPTVFDLLLRGFAPKPIRSLFRKRLAHYEMQTETQSNVYWNPLIVSGCFMFFRSSILKEAQGFSDEYFLYFEDFDLSLRTHQFAQIAYVPSVCIVHAGGHTSKKGLRHILLFLQSALQFYRKHGVKLK